MAAADPLGPLLNGGAFDLDRTTAPSTHQMVVVSVRLAATVDRLTVGAAQHVDLAGLGQALQGAVDRRQANCLPLAAKKRMQVLRAFEVVGCCQRCRHGCALSGGSLAKDAPGHDGLRASVVVMDVNFLGVVHGVLDDVRDVVVGESVGDLASASDTLDQVGTAQHSKVLADEWLGEAQRFDQFVDASLLVGQLRNERDADRRGERAEQLAGLGVAGVWFGAGHMHKSTYSNE
jgi:hypothetical protein